MANLRVCEGLIDRIDWPARNAGSIEPLDYRVTRHRAGDLADQLVEFVTVVAAIFRRRVARVLDQIFAINGLAETAPHHRSRRDIYIAVLGPEHTRRRAGRMIVPGLTCNLARNQITGGLEI